MILTTPNRQNAQVLPSDTTDVIRHTCALYEIELLNEVNPLAVDDPLLAFQFGAIYDTPWKDEPKAVQAFATQHPNLIWNFVLDKAWCAIERLINQAEDLKGECYSPVAIEPNTYNAVFRLLDDFVTGKQVRTGLFLTDKMERSAYASYSAEKIDLGHKAPAYPRGAMRQAPGQYPDLELGDKIVRGIWDTYSTQDEDLSTTTMNNRFGANRMQIADNRVYLCKCALEKLYKWADAEFRASARVKSPMIGVWVRFLSVLYRSVCPTCIQPMSLNSLYEYIKRNADDKLVAKAIQQVRKFSGVNPEAALCACTDLLHFHGAYGVLPHRFMSGQLNPDSLVERYLVLKSLAS